MLPSDYPATPPKVQLITTGGGRVRFNPNLYNCGKVCLSLLGTWAGPGWDPVRSTLLQVLVSIQSLIMVGDPFFNEPGFQSMMGTAQGNKAKDSYNYTVREATVRYAMGEMLRRAGEGKTPFASVIKKHFKLKGSKIQAQLDRWSAQAPASSATSGLPGGGSGLQGNRSGMLSACEDVRFQMSHGASSSGSSAGGKDRPICL